LVITVTKYPNYIKWTMYDGTIPVPFPVPFPEDLEESFPVARGSEFAKGMESQIIGHYQ